MNPDIIRTLVTGRMQQAAECIDDARYLLSSDRGTRTIINRAYYAAFYAVLALLQSIGTTPRKHSGALSLFDSEFVRTGIFSKDMSSSLHRLFDTRQEDDYHILDPIPRVEAAETLDLAESFVQKIQDYLIQQKLISS